MSPLHFNLVGELLSHLLNIAVNKELFKGIKISSSGYTIYNLQYADDVILFLSDDIQSVKGIKRVSQCFELLSGLKINFNKSQLFGYGSHAKKN